METLGDNIQPKFSQNIPHKFYCKICDYGTSKKCNYDTHILSAKHKKAKEDDIGGQNSANFQPEFSQLKNEGFICSCGKEYKHRQGLWKHKKVCEYKDSGSIQNTSIPQITPELVVMLVQQNNNMQSLMMEMMKNGTNNTNTNTNTNSHNNTNTTTNNNNKTFNLNFFLNETCKNAMNLNQFVDEMVLNLSDLEETGRIGFAEGISNMIMKRLRALDVTERPIHCSDLKRETLYIKNENKWEKEDENKPILTNAVKNIAGKNMMQIFDWQKAHPDYNDPDTRTSDKYMKMLTNVMSGGTEEETNANYDKIIRNLIKEAAINKENFLI